MTKQQYLEARAQWKVEHAQLITDIRQAKLDLKAAQRANNQTKVWGAYNDLREARESIIRHLIKRSNMKEQAQRDYLAAKAQREAA